MDKFIPLSVPNLKGNEKVYMDEAIESEWVSTAGPFITRFEQSVADYVGAPEAVACQSGTAGLHLAVLESGLQAGERVLVPDLTFIATVNPIVYAGGVPVFMDCDDTLCIDTDKLRAFCEQECELRDGVLIEKQSGARVRAVMPVHVFGNLCDMDAIMDIAAEFRRFVIEDAAEAMGSRWQAGRYAGMHAGTVGDFGAYSFNGNKIITTGGGGAVTAKDARTVDHVKFLSTQAKTDPHYYIHDEVGYNYRMTNLQAALGVAQMEELPEFIRRKQANWALYDELFDGFELGRLVPFRAGISSNKWFYSLQIDRDRVRASMREIITALEKKGIQTRAIWGLINEQRPYLGETTYRLEKAPWYAERILNIPSGTQITGEEIRYVAGEIRALLKKMAEDNDK